MNTHLGLFNTGLRFRSIYTTYDMHDAIIGMHDEPYPVVAQAYGGCGDVLQGNGNLHMIYGKMGLDLEGKTRGTGVC